MWTISDFPAYGNLAGCIVKGKHACPICGVNTCSKYLHHSKKNVYMGHQQFLPQNHLFRKKESWFNEREEMRLKPRVSPREKVKLACAKV